MSEKFCFLCGSPLHNNNIFDIKEKEKFKKYLSKINEDIELADGVDIDSFVNLLKSTSDKPNIDFIKLYKFVDLKNDKKYKWLNNLIFLHLNGKNYKVLDVDTWDGVFRTNDGEFKLYSNNKFKKDKISKYNDGLVIHEDCYKYLEKRYCKNFNYNNINDGLVAGSNLYETDTIPWLEYFFYNKGYLLESPLKNKKHKETLDKINFDKFISCNISKSDKSNNKTDKVRPSPSESAKLFKVGFIKKGNDGNKWIIMENKNGVKKWKKL